jgi:hypothetical protein
MALLFGVAALISVQALAAAPAGAILTDTCIDVGCGTDPVPGGGPPGDDGGIPADHSSGDAGQPGSSAGDGQGAPWDGDNAVYPGSDHDTSSFDPANDGLDPNPFEDPLTFYNRDYSLALPLPNSQDPFRDDRQNQRCTDVMSALSHDESSLQDLVERIRHPEEFEESVLKRSAGALRRARQGWRDDASQTRRMIRHFRAVYIKNDCDTVLVGRDF